MFMVLFRPMSKKVYKETMRKFNWKIILNNNNKLKRSIKHYYM